MYFNFYEEKRKLVYDNREEEFISRGEIVKTLYSSKLNKVRTETDKQILVYEYTLGRLSGFNKKWQACFAEPLDKHNLRG